MNARIVNIALSIALCAAVMQSCSSDEPDVPDDPVGNNSSVTINPDGSTSNGAQFSRVDETTFYIDFIKYQIVDAHLEIIGCDKTGLSKDVKPYATVTYNGSTYQTRKIGKNALAAAPINSIILPDGLQSIGDYAFTRCRSLTSIQFPEGLYGIGDNAFEDCTSLTAVRFPDGLQSIGNSAFEDCRSLTFIQFPEGLQRIEGSAFYYCNSLTTIELPEGLQFIGNYAFRSCSSLTSVQFPESLQYIGEWVFSSSPNLTSIVSYALIPPTYESGMLYYDQFNDKCYDTAILYVPAQSIDQYKRAYPWDKFKSIQAIQE